MAEVHLLQNVFLLAGPCFLGFNMFFNSLQAAIWFTKICVNAYWFTTLVRLLNNQ